MACKRTPPENVKSEILGHREGWKMWWGLVCRAELSGRKIVGVGRERRVGCGGGGVVVLVLWCWIGGVVVVVTVVL